jgi:hypothetical protein
LIGSDEFGKTHMDLRIHASISKAKSLRYFQKMDNIFSTKYRISLGLLADKKVHASNTGILGARLLQESVSQKILLSDGHKLKIITSYRRKYKTNSDH